MLKYVVKISLRKCMFKQLKKLQLNTCVRVQEKHIHKLYLQFHIYEYMDI